MGKVLFIRGGAIGDFVLTMPAIQLVRTTLPDNEIEVLGYPGMTDLALVTGLADKQRSIVDPKLAPFYAPEAKLDREWCEYFAGFDLVVSCLYDPDGLFAANLKKAGVKTLVNLPFRPDESETSPHASLQLAEPLGQVALFLDDPALELDYPISNTVKRRGAGPLVAVHPGSGHASRNWGFESWAAVLGLLAETHPGIEYVITSGVAETGIIDEFLTILDELDLSYTHLDSIPLTELASVYQQADYYLGHHSGIAHLAASTGTPGLLLFGDANPAVWSPASEEMKVLQSKSKTLSGIAIPDVLERVQIPSYSHPSSRS
ncbi:glycosyltransferase family 9 protein [Verrucomicrobiales bacterium BCK34]|nr:glycosyltransferase family 9 protein [Verrucomicrobiales bacterium BCK34]